uniref:2'-5' RNA ligase family protein n=1 Tax=Altererythrobacter segetis TaxID=1104773 RepID=UPI00140CC4D0|nr:2'-5' RNA ligase family protein [Altererythrobacter segetis]
MSGRAPQIVTAELPADLRALAERLRQAHYPADRNQVAAHVTLFRAVPPSCEEELHDALGAAARQHAPIAAHLVGAMSLGTGTALRIDSPAMLALRAELAGRFHGLLTPQELSEPRLHVTVQNKMPEKEAKALQEELARTLEPRDFRFAGLALHRYLDGPWETINRWSFRG